MNLPIKTPIAQHEPPIVAGSIQPITNRTTKQIIGYRGRLPRSMSAPPKGCKNPATFREWATPLCTVAKHGSALAARCEAIVLLNTVIEQLRTPGHITRGRTFADCAALDIEERYKRSRQRVNHHTAANKRIQCWRNIVKNWLPKAQFWEWPPAAIQLADCQAFVNWLETRARFGDGEPLSASMVRNIIQQMRSVFRRAGVNPEAHRKIQQPPRKKPKVPNLSIEQQCRFFSCKDITIEDRIMAGIGMGLAVRVGELLAIEASQITITSDGRGFVILEYGGNHHSPLKGKGEDRKRTVELHEPGLGFLKIWLRDHYKGGVRLFEGPKGGYMSAWPNKWSKWTKIVGCDKMHSHLMRHTYAVSMLSGTWGYAKQPLEFIKQQLGHTEIRTTEKYYANYHQGAFARGVDQMVGAMTEAPKTKPVIVTAVALLNSADGLSSGLSSGPGSNGKPEKQAGSHKTRGDRWSTHDFPGNAGESADKAACDGPVCKSATAVGFPGRFQPRRRRKIGGVA